MSTTSIIWIVVAALVAARIAWRITKKRKPAEANAQKTTSAKPKKSLTPTQRKLYTIFAFVKINTRRYFRDRTAIFFTIAFPLIFLFIFGGLFGKNTSVSFKVALLDNSNAPYSQQLVKQLESNDAIKVNKTITTMSQADDQMAHGTIDATIVLPQNFGAVAKDSKIPTGNATVYYTENNAEAAQTLTSLLQAEFAGVNTQFVKTQTPFTVASKQTGKAGLTQFDYTFSGLLGFSILGLGIFGPVNTFPELKKQGVLRRFHTTPIRVWQFFIANVVTQALIGLITMVVMFGVAIAVFHLKVVGNYAELAVFLALSIGMIFGIGLAVGGWAQNERQAAPLVNIITFPMMFLSGTFFPRYLMPEFLQHITNYLPLTPVIDGTRLIATEGKGLLDLGPQLGIMGLWLIVIYAIAFRVFRWE
ncbi:MAG TPA: ABC transporter permease [Candidatus Saccharimonadales bacterium]